MNALNSAKCFHELFICECAFSLTITIMVIFIITRQTQTNQKKNIRTLGTKPINMVGLHQITALRTNTR